MNWLLVIFFVFSGQIVVLKNGKVMRCDSFSVKGSQVEIHLGKKVFSLPLSMVNLEKSGDYEPESSPEADKKSHIKSQPSSSQKSKRPKRNIVLTTKDLKPNGSQSSKGGSLSYQKIGNSIVVEIGINGQGPFQVILDTGANATVLAPSLLNKLRIQSLARAVSMVGVSGTPVQGLQVKIDEITVAGQSVSDLDVVSYEIPQLTELGVAGLLGQDFLNHFVVHMDTSTNMLTLTPHGKPVETSMFEKQFNLDQKLSKWRTNVRQLETIGRSIASMLRKIAYNRSGALDQNDSRTLKGYNQDLSQIRMTFSELSHELTQLNEAEVRETDRPKLKGFLNCYPAMSNYLNELQGFCTSLRSYVNTNDPDRLMRAIEKLERRNKELKGCGD